MNLKKSPFTILNKGRRKIEAEIESYKDFKDDEERDTIQVQDVLMLDRISI